MLINFSEKDKKWGFLRDVLWLFKWLIFLQICVAFIWAIDLSLRPYIVKIILDRISGSTDGVSSAHFLSPILWYIISFFVAIVAYRVYDWIILKRNPLIKKVIIVSLFDYLLGHSTEFFQNHLSGSLVNRINDLANSLPALITLVIDRFLSVLLALCFAIYASSTVGIEFALTLLVWVTMLFLFPLLLLDKARKLTSRVSEMWSDVAGKTVDAVSNVSSIRLFVGKDYEVFNLLKSLQKAVSADQANGWFLLQVYSVHGASFLLLQVVSIYFLIRGLQNGSISVGDFALILSINSSLSEQLFLLTQDITLFSEYVGKINNALNSILLSYEINDLPEAKDLVVSQGQIVFKDVKFNYKDTEHSFSSKNLVIEAGKKVGLVGHSGSGKTTFVNLILRLFNLQAGGILIDDQDIAAVTQSSLRKSIAIVPQDMPLFHRSLMENIRYGRTEASDEEVIEAAKKAHAHDFIINLPQGYNTLVGERGLKISGGQRQRIAIARAILKNASILIFDEATSALDNVTENMLQDSLWDLMQGRTNIVIAHRLATLQWMDKILVFQDGAIVEEGSHQELLEINGVYKEMWQSQVGILQREDDAEKGQCDCW